MSTIEEKIIRLHQYKSDIKRAIIEKGQKVEDNLSTYANAIQNIKGGGTDAKCEVTFNEEVVALKVKMNDTDISEEVISHGNVLIPEITGDVNIKVSEYKSITYITNNVTLTNTPSKMPVTYTYDTNLSCDYGYEFDEVIIMMGGVDVTNTVFNVTSTKNDSATLHIGEVNGDITVSVRCVLKTYTITNNNSHTSSNNSATTITHGQPYTAVITADEHYDLTSVNVVMNGNIVVNETWDELDGHHTYTITIPQALEDITITTSAKMVIIVTNNLTNITTNNSVTKYKYGVQYTETLSSTKYYDFTTITSDDATLVEGSTVLNETTRIRTKTLTIPSLTKDVTINAVAERKVWNIAYSLTGTTSDIDIVTINEGEKFEATFTPNQYFEFNTITITHNSKDASANFNQSTGKLTINEVIGDININIISTNIVCTITNTLDTPITTNNNATTVLMGQPYSELLTLNTSTYDYMTVSVTMGGEPINYNNMVNGDINIPLVLGDIIVTGHALMDTLQQYNTLDHYTFDEIDEIESGESVEVMLVSPRKDHGYTFGYDGEHTVNNGNGYKNLILMQNSIAPLSTNNNYIMSLYKKQDTKMEDVYGEVVKTFTVSGSLYNSNITKLNSTINGYDLYGLSSNLSISRNTTRTGTVTITFNGKASPNTKVYARMYASTTGGTTNITVNGQTINPTTSTSTSNLSEFTAVTMNSMSLTMNLSANNNAGLFGAARTYNVYFLVPNNITEIEVVGQQEVPDGLPYFALTTKMGNRSVTELDNARATPEGFNIFRIDEITLPNQTIGLLPHNNPCVFKFSRISDSKWLSSGSEIGPLAFVNGESDTTVWYLYKPNTAGYSTSSVTVTNTLTHVETSNTTNSVAYGGSYTTTFSWDASKTPYRLKITMCGHDITDSVYNETTRQVNIPYVIGNIENLVAVVDIDDMKKVRYNLIDVAGVTDKTGYSESMSTDEYDAVLVGDKYTSKPTFEGLTKLSSANFEMDIEPSKYKYMKVSECYADMGGERLDNIYNPNTNTITIPSITDDCLITVKALYIVGYIDDTYYDSDKSNNHIFVESDALGSGTYNAKYTKYGENLTNEYNNITSFTI